MSNRSNAASHHVDATGEPSETAAAPTIKARGDDADCCCLDCRNVSVATTRRTLVDALVWTGRLCRSSPSILLFAVAFVVAGRALEFGGSLYLPIPVVDLLDSILAFGLLVILRAYVASVAAGELTGSRVTPRNGIQHVLDRLPALIGLSILFVLVVFAVMFLTSMVAFAAVVIGGGVVSLTGFDLAATLVVSLFIVIVLASFAPLIFVLFKCWFAIEACVVGEYGPFESLRISWTITTNYRGKALFLVGSALASAGSLFLVGFLPGIEDGSIPFGTAVGVLSTSLGELLSVVWFGVYSHLYVQGILELDGD
ncbi:hypothetical protein ACLI4Z_16360 [Natrialbaceae archaeon A-arb3/5]